MFDPCSMPTLFHALQPILAHMGPGGAPWPSGKPRMMIDPLGDRRSLDPNGVRDGLKGVASDEQINRGELLLAQRPVGWSVRIRLIPCGRHRVFLAP